MVLAALATFAFPVPGIARDWYVDRATGSDQHPAWRVHSSFERSYQTIGQAIRQAEPGDVIRVKAGTYSEYLSITKPLTIVGEGEVVIDGQGTEQSGISIDRADGVVLRNLTFARCSYGVYIHSSAVSIEECVFKENASAVFVYDPDRREVAVTKSAFLRNGTGIHSYYHPGSIAVTSCDFVDNGTALYRQWSESAVAVDRTIFAGNGKTFWYQAPDGGYAFVPESATSCNLFANRSADELGTGSAYQPRYAADPLFVDPAADDLYLRPGSPMVVPSATGTTLIGAYGIRPGRPADEPAVADPTRPTEPAIATLPSEVPARPVTPDTPRRPTILTLPNTVPEEAPVPAVTPTTELSLAVEPTPALAAEQTQTAEVATVETPAAPAATDTVAPVSELATDLPVGARKAVLETRLTLTATDPAGTGGSGSGVARLEYRANGGDWVAYTTPFELREALPRGVDCGLVAIGYRAIDQAGNKEAERTASFEVQPALAVSARLLPAPRVLCWWNEKESGEGWERALQAVFDSAALDSRIVESGRDFLAALPDYNVYLILGDREQLDRVGSAVLAAQVAAGRSVLAFGFDRIPTPAEDGRGWENIFGIKVAGTLNREALLALRMSAVSDTRCLTLAGKTAKVTEVLAGEVWGEAGELKRQDEHGHGHGHDGHDNADDRSDTWPAVIAGSWEQGKLLYVGADYGQNQAALADLLRRSIVWAEPAGALAQPGNVVAVGIRVGNATLPIPLRIAVEAEPPAGSAVTRVLDDGRASNVVTWYGDLDPGAEREYRFLLRLPEAGAPGQLRIDASYVKDGVYRVTARMVNLGED